MDKAPTLRELTLSKASDPLRRLAENAICLVRSTWMLAEIAKHPASLDPNVSLHVPMFTARMRAVGSHEGREWQELSAANDRSACGGGTAANSHVELALALAQRVYVVLLGAAQGDEAANVWPLKPDVHDLDVSKISSRWPKIREKLADMPEFDNWLLEHEIAKELQRAESAKHAPEAHQAHRVKLFPKGLPSDQNLVDCIVKLEAERDGDTADFDILLQFFDGDADKAESMQSLIRKARLKGVTTLPVNPERTKRSPT